MASSPGACRLAIHVAAAPVQPRDRSAAVNVNFLVNVLRPFAAGPVLDRASHTPHSILVYPKRLSRLPKGFGPSSKTKDNLMQRSTQPPLSLRMAKRCGAKSRTGKPCQSPVVKGRKRCRMHGGAHGSGAPSGKRNGNYRHGFYTAEAIAERKAVRAWLRSLRRF
jgi:hypothetical protein